MRAIDRKISRAAVSELNQIRVTAIYEINTLNSKEIFRKNKCNHSWQMELSPTARVAELYVWCNGNSVFPVKEETRFSLVAQQSVKGAKYIWVRENKRRKKSIRPEAFSCVWHILDDRVSEEKFED